MIRPVTIAITALAVAAPLSAQHSLGGSGPYDPAIPTPASVLGYELGEAFTPHHELVRYLSALAEASDRVRLDTVAITHEGRPVLLATATSAANQVRLEELRAGALRLADPRGVSEAELDRLVAEQPTIVWLGYTVHGDEASGVEAAMGTLYQLAAGQDPETQEILDNVITLVDPVQNPDGHDRHVNQVAWDEGRFGPDPDPRAVVHDHDWHGARTNHYLFDLNRDWLVHAQPETRGRMAAFRSWYPHVAVDLHEMGASSTYFFAPPMEPVHANIHPLVHEGWQLFGRANAAAFAANGWGFFTRESFDEFFPGYGPSWPLHSGAIGMTYEQASSEGGAIERDDGSILTLTEAARHHYTASRATLRTAAQERARRVANFLTFRRDAVRNALGGTRTIIIGQDGQGRADSLAALLLRHDIEIGRTDAERRIRATAFGGDDATAIIPAGSYIVDLAQPEGVLARTLLEPDPAFDPDFLREEQERREAGLGDRFYDMTGWSLPFLYRVSAWHTSRPVTDVASVPSLDRWVPGAGPAAGPAVSTAATAASGAVEDAASPVGVALPERAGYAYVFAPGSEASLRMLAGLLADEVRVRHASRAFRAAGVDFPGGVFVVPVHRNRGGDDGASLHAAIRAHAAESGARVIAVQSALAEDGTDLGSNTVRSIPVPRVALVGGDGISSNSYGAAWYAFDQLLQFPVTRTNLDALTAALDRYNVVVLPSAWSPGSTFGDRGTEALRSWIEGGGTLITLGGATRWLASENGFARIEERSLGDAVEGQEETESPLRASVPGVVVRAAVDTLSPLVAGIRDAEIPVVVSGGIVYDAPGNARPGEAVIRYVDADRLRLAGFLWPEIPARLAGATYLWTEEIGRGRVIAFAGDPNERAMFRGLLPVFANAVFLGGSY